MAPLPAGRFPQWRRRARPRTRISRLSRHQYHSADGFAGGRRSGNATTKLSALEGPVTQTTAIGPGGGRTLTSGRTMAIDSSGAAAYMISVSGLSIIPLTTVPAAQKPLVSRGGAVNVASYQSAVAVNGLLSIFGSNLGQRAGGDGRRCPRFWAARA